MSNFKHHFNKFLSLPLNTVGEIFLASVLIILTFTLDIFRTYSIKGNLGFSFIESADDRGFLPFIFLFLFGIFSALYLTIRIFFLKRPPEKRTLRLLQFAITPFIFYTWAVYAFFATPRFIDAVLGGVSLNIIDYLLLFYMVIVFIRLIVIFLFLDKWRIDIPRSKFISLNPFVLIAITLATLVIYFQDTSSLSFALARSFMMGSLLLNTIDLFKYDNKINM